jgi:hypothetical protein
VPVLQKEKTPALAVKPYETYTPLIDHFKYEIPRFGMAHTKETETRALPAKLVEKTKKNILSRVDEMSNPQKKEVIEVIVQEIAELCKGVQNNPILSLSTLIIAGKLINNFAIEFSKFFEDENFLRELYDGLEKANPPAVLMEPLLVTIDNAVTQVSLRLSPRKKKMADAFTNPSRLYEVTG